MDQLSFADIIHVLYRQWRTTAVIIFLAVVGSIAWTLLFVPQTWRATCTILFEPSLSSSSLPSGLAGLLPLSAGRSRETYLAVLQSRQLRERVVERLNLVTEFDADDVFQAQEWLEYMYSISTRRNVGDLLAVRATAGCPPRQFASHQEKADAAKLAADIANALIEELGLFLEDADYMRASQRSEYLQQQYEQAERQVIDAQDALVKYAVENGLVSPQSQVGEALKAASDLERRMRELQMQVEGAREREREAVAQLDRQERMVISSVSEQRNPAIDEIQSRIRDGQRQVAQLTEVEGKSQRHPDVERIQVELEQARQQLQDEVTQEMRVTRQDMDTSPSYTNTLQAALDAQLDRSGLEAQLSSALEARKEVLSGLQTLPSSAAQYTYLERQLELRASVYEQVAKQYEMSRATAASAMPKFTVLDAAIPPRKASGPSLKQNAFLALIVSSVVALVLAFWRQGRLDAARDADAAVEDPDEPEAG